MGLEQGFGLEVMRKDLKREGLVSKRLQKTNNTFLNALYLYHVTSKLGGLKFLYCVEV